MDRDQWIERNSFEIYRNFCEKFCEIFRTPGSRLFLEIVVLFIAIFISMLMIMFHLTLHAQKGCLPDLIKQYNYDPNSEVLRLQIKDSDYSTTENTSCHLSQKVNSYRSLNDYWKKSRNKKSDCNFIQELYEYSLHKSYIFSSESTREKLNVTTRIITIESDSVCFGTRFERFLLRLFVGRETLISNWFLFTFKGHGYLLSKSDIHQPLSVIYNLHYSLPISYAVSDFDELLLCKIGILTASLFIFFISFLIVRISLRSIRSSFLYISIYLTLPLSSPRIQNQIQIHSQTNASNNSSSGSSNNNGSSSRSSNSNSSSSGNSNGGSGSSSSRNHLLLLLDINERQRIELENRVLFIALELTNFISHVMIIFGLFYIHSILLEDNILSFLLINLIILIEIFHLFCVRSNLSIRFFPPFVFFYFMAFFIYFFSFPFGFSYFGFITLQTWLLHLCVMFFTRVELVNLANGRVNINRNRDNNQPTFQSFFQRIRIENVPTQIRVQQTRQN